MYFTKLDSRDVDFKLFVNRAPEVKWLEKSIDGYLEVKEDRIGRAFRVTGAKGSGKTIFARHVLERLKRAHSAKTLFLEVDCRKCLDSRAVFGVLAQKIVEELVSLKRNGALIKDELLDTARVLSTIMGFTSVELKVVHEHVTQYKAAAALAGDGWLQRELKAPLYRALGGWLKQSGHPLSTFNVQAMPVIQAAGLTTDPVELVDLLERCLVHRIRYADIGCEESDYRRSLLLVAGERLAERLSELKGEELKAALEVILFEARGPEVRERFLTGAAGLVKVGLASFVAGDLRLGPLARSIVERELLGGLEAKIEKGDWTEESRRKLSEFSHSVGSGRGSVSMAPMVVTGGTDGVPLPMDDLRGLMNEVFPGESEVTEHLALLQDLTRLPAFTLGLTEELHLRLVQALRLLDFSSGSSLVRQREASRLLSGLLQLIAARGTDAVEVQEGAVRQIQEALDRLSPHWAEDLRLAVLFWNASTRVRWPRGSEDLNAAAGLLEACIVAWTEAERRTAGHLLLGEIAAYREDHARAREHYAAALQLAIGAADYSNEAAAKLGLARAALAESRFADAEQRARESFAYYKEAGDSHATAVASFLLGASLGNLQQREEAERLLDQALKAFKISGDIAAQVECIVYLAGTVFAIGQRERAESLAKEAVVMAESAGLRVSQAFALAALAGFVLARGAIDEASELFEQASDLYDRMGVRPKSAEAMRGAFTTLMKKPSTHAWLGGLMRVASALTPLKS